MEPVNVDKGGFRSIRRRDTCFGPSKMFAVLVSCFLAIYPDVILPVQLDSSGMPVDAKFQILLLVRGVGVGGVKMR